MKYAGTEARHDSATRNSRRSTVWTTLGIGLIVFSIYVLSGPGRIDIIDGQLRYEVSANLVQNGRPELRDKFITSNAMLAVRGKDGAFYSFYCIAGSVFAAPFVWLGGLLGSPEGEGQRFLFSLSSGLFGALAACVLYIFYIDLGVSKKRALMWCFVSAFATLLWPTSTSTFDNAQHSFFSLFAIYLGYRSAIKKSIGLSIIAGVVAGILINYQEYFVLLIPALALSCLTWQGRKIDDDDAGKSSATKSRTKSSGLDFNDVARGIGSVVSAIRKLAFGDGEYAMARRRYLAYACGAWSGAVVFFFYNYMRFGSIFNSGKFDIIAQGHPVFFGSFFIGLPGLLVSPGKSIFLYSPPIILGLIGIRRLWRVAPQVGLSVATTSFVLLMFLSKISFFGGDWCWGPRYLVILLPLWALAFPFLPKGNIVRVLAITIVVIGFAVQVMALSVDHYRFFLENDLPGHFWADEPGFYMRKSALFARAGEMMSLSQGVPRSALQFTQTPYEGTLTYCIFGVRPINGLRLSQWIKQYQVFYLPRPWPLWMREIDPEQRPINLEAWVIAMMLMLGIGV